MGQAGGRPEVWCLQGGCAWAAEGAGGVPEAGGWLGRHRAGRRRGVHGAPRGCFGPGCFGRGGGARQEGEDIILGVAEAAAGDPVKAGTAPLVAPGFERAFRNAEEIGDGFRAEQLARKEFQKVVLRRGGASWCEVARRLADRVWRRENQREGGEKGSGGAGKGERGMARSEGRPQVESLL